MKKQHWLFSAVVVGLNLLLVVAGLLTVYGAAWEYSTRCYLKGFAEAVVPYTGSPEAKAEAILAWMGSSPARRYADSTGTNDVLNRDPENTLNVAKLLEVCGTATNAFVNLADSTGIESRRLLLLTPTGTTTHVVAEVMIDGRWVIADPAFHTMLKDAEGRLLTRRELADPAVFNEATKDLAGYKPTYNYQNTAHLRVASIPVVGNFLKKVLDLTYSGWQETLDWTMFLERSSYSVLMSGILLVSLTLFARVAVISYGEKRLGLIPPSFLAQLRRITLSSGQSASQAFRTGGQL